MSPHSLFNALIVFSIILFSNIASLIVFLKTLNYPENDQLIQYMVFVFLVECMCYSFSCVLSCLLQAEPTQKINKECQLNWMKIQTEIISGCFFEFLSYIITAYSYCGIVQLRDQILTSGHTQLAPEKILSNTVYLPGHRQQNYFAR